MPWNATYQIIWKKYIAKWNALTWQDLNSSENQSVTPCTAPPYKGEARAPIAAWHREELLGGVFYHGHEGSAWVTPPGGEAQTAEIVGDELKVPKVNGFTKWESTSRQMLTVGSDGDHRWWNDRNV
jgi:hypothetical protein